MIEHFVGVRGNPGYVFPNSKDFRNFINVFTDGLRQLCNLAQQNVNSSIRIFNSSFMLAKQIMPRVRFNNEINSTLVRFQQKTPIEFARTLNLIRTTIQGNALVAVFSTNWQVVVDEKGQGSNASFHNVPIVYVDAQQNTTCSCATLQSCTMPAQFFNNTYTLGHTIEGLRLGCYSLETVLQSSLWCFYSAACILKFRRFLRINQQEPMFYQNLTNGMLELNSTITRFNITDTVEVLANEMFIESWTSNASYERFFNSCAPSSCTIREYYRFDALELLTTFLTVYVGLSLGIRFIVPYLIRMIKKIRNRFRVVPVQ